MKLRNKMVLEICAATFVIFIALGVTFLATVSNYIRSNIDQDLENTMTLTRQLIDASMESSVRSYLRGDAEKAKDLIAYYFNQVENGAMSRKEATARLKALWYSPEFGKIGDTGYLVGLDSNGIALLHPKLEGADLSRSDQFKRAMTMKNGFIEFPARNPGETETREEVGYRTYFEPWDIIIWAASYKDEFKDIVDLRDIKDYLLSIKIGKTGYPYVLDPKGTMVVHPSLENRNVFETPDARGKYIFKEILAKKNGRINYYWANPGETSPRQKFAIFEYLPQYDATLVISSYTEEFYGVLTIISAISIAAILVALGIYALLVFLVASRITRALGGLSASFALMSRGNLNQRIADSSNDELGEIARNFNTFTQSLNGSIENLKKVAANSRGIGSSLASNSSEVSATINEITATVNAMNDKITLLHDEIEASGRSATDISRTIEIVARLIADQSISVGDSSAAVQQMIAGIETMEKTTEGKKALADQLAEMATTGERNMRLTVDSIREISTSTELILDLIKVINDVSSKTNLLAMNAAIEAAHAGEYGRGFSVVADEIRKLAETSSSSAKSISASLHAMIAAIQSTSAQTGTTNDLIARILSGIKDVSAGMNETLAGLRETMPGGRQITAQVSNLVKVTTEVRDASVEMNASASGITSSSGRINDLAIQYRDGISEIAAGMNEILKSAVSLSDMSSDNSQAITILESEIGKFETE